MQPAVSDTTDSLQLDAGHIIPTTTVREAVHVRAAAGGIRVVTGSVRPGAGTCKEVFR
jgi:hypothetical protein